MSETDRLLKSFGIAFIIVLVITCIFEAIILGVAYFGADEVDCTWLWCTFKSTKGESSFTRTSYSCYQNGIEVNCSDMPTMDNIIEKAIGTS